MGESFWEGATSAHAPASRVAGVLEGDDSLDQRARLDGFVCETLDVDHLASTAGLVGGKSKR